MKIYNSLTNKIEEFKEIDKNTVKMYVCGPTVYNFIHIGNARPVIFFDVVKRYFEYRNYKVIFASNITDIDDKIIKQAIEKNVTEKEIATNFENCYFEDCDRLNSKRPDIIPRATEYLTNMVDLIQEMIDKGFAYKVDNDIYFRVDKIDKYGILSNQNLDELKDNVRITNNSNKENIKDFTLWKKPSEGIIFNTKIGCGRPGWHTECVAMNEAIFNGKIDIHGGGSDLKFPHHENEIAQSLALRNHTIANYFMHVGRVNLNGEKMSKSTGNFILVRDLLSKYDYGAFRLLILNTQYRQNINFNEDLMKQFEKEYKKIVNTVQTAFLTLDVYQINNIGFAKTYLEQMENFLDNDFNTGNVITLIYDLIKKINVCIRNHDLDLLAIQLNTVLKMLEILGIEFNYKKLDEQSRNIYNQWEKARIEKDFEKADSLRKILIEKGIIY